MQKALIMTKKKQDSNTGSTNQYTALLEHSFDRITWPSYLDPKENHHTEKHIQSAIFACPNSFVKLIWQEKATFMSKLQFRKI